MRAETLRISAAAREDGQKDILRVAALDRFNADDVEDFNESMQKQIHQFQRVKAPFRKYKNQIGEFSRLLKENKATYADFLDLEAAINHYEYVVNEEYYAQGFMAGYFLDKGVDK
jgi:hypothetical protein